MIGSLRNRILAITLLLVLSALGATFTATLLVVDETVRNQLSERLATAARVFELSVDTRLAQLDQSASVLADDFGFKRAVATRDAPTIRSALVNHASRIDADLAAYAGDQGDTVSVGLPQGVAAGLLEGVPSGITSIAGRPFMVVKVPVRAPRPVGTLTIGLAMGEQLAREVSDLVGTDLTLVSRSDTGETFLASTLPEAARQASAEMLDGTVPDAWTTPVVEGVAGADYMTVQRRLGPEGQSVTAALQAPVDAALSPYRTLQKELVAITAVVVVLAILLSVVAARSVTEPLQKLVSAAQRIEAGDYDSEVTVPPQREMAVLGRTFNSMRESIAERQRRIVYEANHDQLTGLPNRSYATEQLAEAVAECLRERSTAAVILIDIANFSQVNDAFGFNTGDELLKQFADRLVSAVRGSDVVARIGSDEFLVILPGLEQELAMEFARRLQRSSEQVFSVREVEIQLEASVGVVMVPEHSDNPNDLMRRGDLALMLAKQRRDRFAIYESESEDRHLRKLTLMRELRAAIDRGELELHYQPKLRLGGGGGDADRDGEIFGVEALVRWTHAELGPVSPAEFIPLAEQTGKVGGLTRFVLRRAFETMAAWVAEGRSIPMAVNLSAVDLADEDLPEWIGEEFERTGAPPELLIFEITESAVVQDFEAALELIRSLSTAGSRIAIDDFGTGESSLAHLQRMPVHELKLDRAFVAPMDGDDQARSIVRTVITLAHDLGLDVVAEGVETQESMDHLRGLGCEAAQGFYILRPSPAAELFRWMDAGAAPVGVERRA